MQPAIADNVTQVMTVRGWMDVCVSMQLLLQPDYRQQIVVVVGGGEEEAETKGSFLIRSLLYCMLEKSLYSKENSIHRRRSVSSEISIIRQSRKASTS